MWGFSGFWGVFWGGCFFFFFTVNTLSPLRDWFADQCQVVCVDLSYLTVRLWQAADGWEADALGCANLWSVGSEGCPHTERLSCYPTHQPDLPVQIRR